MPKPCKEDQIRNPDTNRCVSKTSAIGKRVIKKMSKTAAAPATSRAARAAPPVSVRPPASEAYKAELRLQYPTTPMNILLDMYPEPMIDSDEIKASRIPVFSKRSKLCPEDKIKDPETKKCIIINSVKGRQILDKIREIYYGEDNQGYLSNNPFTIKYDNRQLTIPGFKDLHPETDQPQRYRDCPSKTIRDPNNRDKCIKYNSKKGREIIAKYRNDYKEVYGRVAAPDYFDVPDFKPDDGYFESFILPATKKLTIKTAIPILEKLQKQRLEAFERINELEKQVFDLENALETELRLREEAEDRVDEQRELERIEQIIEDRQEDRQTNRRTHENILRRNQLTSSFINNPNPDNIDRYFESRRRFINLD